MAYMAQPSFLIAPASTGHQFYSARLVTRNRLTNQPDRLVVLQTGVRNGVIGQHIHPDAVGEYTLTPPSQ
jgi:hypothetical protein